MTNFKAGMRQLTGSVTIVTAGVDSLRAGLTATAVCSVSVQPPRLLACLNKSGTTFGVLQHAGTFCINILASCDFGLAQRFSVPIDPGSDRFDIGEWILADGRAPRLSSALAAFACEVHSITMLGSHGLVIGDVVEVFNSAQTPPLLYHDGSFATISTNSDMVIKA